ncbi:hypothetical protein PR048_020995 [Dryococelus australis]|uniref:Chromo domain-containing protein n=1 Tax=Dryococelus australis TaxID=614101 RepID=A0ABQ9GWZ7_9NEOP|nr:hypothetical protein PR048_020995 [Dryococelus australis]
MWKQFLAQGSYKWLQRLPNLISAYNHRVHHTIGMCPVNVKDNSLNEECINCCKPEAKISDIVCISQMKNVFDEGYSQSYSQLYLIYKICYYEPRTYYLEEVNRQCIKCGFYSEEIRPTNFPGMYLVEKVLRRKGDCLFVRWLGFPDENNSWIHKDAVINK